MQNKIIANKTKINFLAVCACKWDQLLVIRNYLSYDGVKSNLRYVSRYSEQAMGWKIRASIPDRAGGFCLLLRPRPAIGSTHRPVQRVHRCFSMRVKGSGLRINDGNPLLPLYTFVACADIKLPCHYDAKNIKALHYLVYAFASHYVSFECIQVSA